MSIRKSTTERWRHRGVSLLLHIAAAATFVGTSWALPTGGIPWVPFTSDAYSAAERSGSPFVVTFSAEWCAPCKEMEAKTYRDPAVLEAAAGVHFLYVDMTEADSYVSVVMKSFKVLGAPTTVFFGTDRKERSRKIGYITPADYARMLQESRLSRPAPATET